MNDILKQLYEGDIHIEEQLVPTTEEYCKQKARIRELEEAFYKILPSELKDDFTKIIEARIRLTGIEVEEACIEGMRIGGRIANAFYNRPKAALIGENCEFEP